MNISMVTVPTKVASVGSVDFSHTLALFDLTVDTDGLVAQPMIEGTTFDRTQYSLFKYGDRAVAERYGV